MRLLHLIDAASAQASSTTLALLAQSLGRMGAVEQHVWLLGGGPLQAAAAAAGLGGANVHHLGVPFGRAMLGYAGVRSRLGLHRNGPDSRFDLVHCWSAHPLGAATLAATLFRRCPRVVTLTTAPTPAQVHFLRFLVQEAQGPTVFLPISATIRRSLLAGGLQPEAVHVLRPGLDMGAIPSAARQELRKGWGVESDNVKVAMLLSDPPQAADAVAGFMGVGLAAETYHLTEQQSGPEFRLVLHPDQHRRPRAAAIARDLTLARSVDPSRLERIVTDARVASPWEILPGCDIALALGPHAGGLSLLWAMAANVPIVGEATYAVSEIVEDRHSALLAKPGQAKAVAQRITQLVADPRLAWKLRDTARHEAYSFFSRQRYVQSLQAVYNQVVSAQPVEVPALPVTGGLRFTGRA